MESTHDKQLINFLNPKLGAKVTCTVPVTDCYEAENLISENTSIKSRGFLAYQSVKPPVELEFVFPCTISIHCVKLNTTVGTQRCCGIEIFSKHDKDAPYISVGRAIYDKAGVIFCNSRRMKPDHSLLQRDNDKEICYLKSNSYKAFLNCVYFKVVIFRTVKSVPCMGSVEVWGVPARSCSAVTVQTIHRIMQNSSRSVNDDMACSTSSFLTNSNRPHLAPKDVFQIPEDFRDDLTFEVMAIPMTLPSGKTVDQSTLDKHMENEKSFGRKPCDPFTGLKFTDSRKPVLNVALKSRIDLFMIKNHHREETYKVARTVGRAHIGAGNSNNKRKHPNSEDSDARRNVVGIKSCCVCDSSANLYSIISCNHFYCRSCVLECCKTLVCSLCEKRFKRDDVVKENMSENQMYIS